MPRYMLEVSYDGTDFRGWQSQPDGSGVQDAMEAALRSLGEDARVTGAGRTDAGVHARAQIAHVDLAKDWEPRRLTLALNAKLSLSANAISVMRTALTGDSFHARKSAVSREYRYFIWNSSTCYPYLKKYVFWLPGSHYDWGRAKAVAPCLVGEHDFRAFCRTVDCPDVTMRTVEYARLFERGNLLMFRIVANAYLTNMIRIAVGNLVSVAAGKHDAEWFEALLSGKGKRAESAQTASASGLFFWKATYPDSFDSK